MSFPPNYSENYLELRKAKFNYILIAFVIFISLIANIADKEKSTELFGKFYPVFSWSGFGILCVITSIIFFIVFNLLDNKIKLKISEEGIWSRKYQLIPWKDIWYITTDESKSTHGKGFSLTIKLKKNEEEETERELNIPLAELNYNKKKLQTVMNFFCKKYGIINLGHNYI